MKKNIKKISAGTLSACVMMTLYSPVVKAEKLRFNGADRIETAIKVGDNYFKNGTSYAVLAGANNENLIDSLIAAPLAKAYDAPIVNHFKGNDVDKTILNKLKSWKVKTIFLASGYKVFSKTFENKLKAEGFNVVRLGDDDPEKTSLNIAKKLEEKQGKISKACIVSSDQGHLVDSLSISPIACMENMPILLSNKSKLSKPVKEYILSKKLSNVYAIGGNTILSDNVLKEANAKRIFGKDRYDTNIKIIEEFKKNLEFKKVFISSGRNANIVDALSGSVASSKESSPIILVGDSVQNVTKDFIKGNVNKEAEVYVFGGEGAVTSSVADEVELIKNGEEDGILKVKEISLIENNSLLVKLNTSLNNLSKYNFVLKNSSGEKLSIASAFKAPFDKTSKTAVVNLKDVVTAGKVYTLNNMEFKGENIKSKKPGITSMESVDFNKVEINFSKNIDIKDLLLKFKDSNGQELKVKDVSYSEENPNTLEVTTEDQLKDVTYSSSIKGAKDFIGNFMEEDTKKTFKGIGKDTSTPFEVKEAKALNPRNVLISFNSIVDKDTLNNLKNFTLTELHSSKCINIKEARIGRKSDGDFKSSKDAKRSVILTLEEPLEDSTMYTVISKSVKNTAGTLIDAKKESADFIGIGPFTTKMDINEEGNNITSINSNRVRVEFKRHIQKETLLSSNFKIVDVYSKEDIPVKSVKIINDRTIDLETYDMKEKLYKLQFNNIKDVDENEFDSKKSSKIFKGTSKSSDIAAIESAKLLDDKTSLILTFDNVLGDNAEELTNYYINNGIGNPIKAQRVIGDSKSIKLTIPLTVNKLSYEVTVSNLQNLDGKTLDEKLYKSFIGSGKEISELGASKVEALDKNTLRIYFDFPVTSKLIDGENRIWNSNTNTLNSNAITIIGKNSVDLNQYYNNYVYKDKENENALIVRSDNLNLSKDNANSNNKFELVLKGSKRLQFNYNDESMKEISVENVEAINKETIRVYFNQPTEIEKGAELGRITNNVEDANRALVGGYGGLSYYKSLKNPTPVGGSYKIYDFKVTPGYLDITDNYLVINPYLNNSSVNGIHDYTENEKAGFVTMKDDNKSNYGIQQMYKFYGTTKTTEDIRKASLKMKDSRTIEIIFPEAMNFVEGGVNSVLNKNNYVLVDKDGKEINKDFMYIHLSDISYDSDENKVTLILNEDIKGKEEELFLKISKNIKNALDTKYVRNTNGKDIVENFERSFKEPQKLKLSSKTYYKVSSRSLFIKFNGKAYGTLPYDKSIFLIDFSVTLMDASGREVSLQSDDIEKIVTNIKDSTSAKDDGITVILKNNEKLRFIESGKVKLKEDSTIKSINGQDSEESEVDF
ncbi:cell wall-binding repeat-containing protein [Haloimpatiens sp. FM7315]|uniref:cell wall-binding repeat-containing protein n=1 Tax=Haloimpatiens sp. FM7315 TaxID=3298609 RepID=UPI00370C6D91